MKLYKTLLYINQPYKVRTGLRNPNWFISRNLYVDLDEYY